ncbi:MAG: carboxypeptidase-like regulatory domain-containing protein, partial [Bacteroidales bacterium]|nr:carboxypeptidase-like regulatory domain-containing protein [Bacteroidales bacterium]
MSRCLAVLLLAIISVGAFAQPRTVTGTVTDINGDPMVGVNVLEKGTLNGVVTDLDGRYSLQLGTSNPVIVFSFIGFLGVEESVGTRSVINVSMAEDKQNLDEVVVIGYGTARKIDITGAVTRADMTALENSPNVNVLQALKGTVPGLNIGVATTAGGSPSITIRGTNTISGST